MAYIGNQPTDNFVTFATQNFSTSATSSYTLSHAVSNENEIALFINNVRQHPGSGKAYTASGTALTLSANTASTDVMYCIFLGRAIQSTVPATNSIKPAMLSLDDGVTITTDDNTDTLTLKSTDADANSGPKLSYYRNSSSPADSDYIGQTSYVGRNDNSQDVNYVSINVQANDVSDGTEDGTYIINTMRAGALDQTLNINPTEVIINEDSKDVDFRAESNGNTHGLFLQASDGMVGFGTSSGSISNAGIKIFGTESGESNTGGMNIVAQGGNDPLALNRLGGDGDLISLRSETTEEGTVAVSGSTVSYNTFTGTHWSRLADNSKPTILKGTVMETLDTMCDWYNLEFEVTEGGSTFTEKVPHALTASQSAGDKITYDHNGTDYEATIVKEDDIKHVQTKISTTDEAKNVYGVFHAWDIEAYNDMMVAAVGTYIVRIHKDETVAKGDLLQSNGDGTAKKQSDDNIKSSTFAKVLSNTKIETYSDDSYIVPCSLMC
jgi:hypothetical protein